MSVDFIYFTCSSCKEDKKVTCYILMKYKTIEERDELEKNNNLHECWIECIDNPDTREFWRGKPDIRENQCYGRVCGFLVGLYIVNKPYKQGDILCDKCIYKLSLEGIITHIWTH
jgi:hypothetical protein